MYAEDIEINLMWREKVRGWEQDRGRWGQATDLTGPGGPDEGLLGFCRGNERPLMGSKQRSHMVRLLFVVVLGQSGCSWCRTEESGFFLLQLNKGVNSHSTLFFFLTKTVLIM